MYDEDCLLPLSALQHLAFCPRQCALIHLEQEWRENRLTAEGRVIHGRVDAEGAESRDNLRIVRSLELCSLRLGIVGRADVVEFRRNKKGVWCPKPIEYKRGRMYSDGLPNKIQLCAQAICLEEMIGCQIKLGCIFYRATRQRISVSFDTALRNKTENAAHALHELFKNGQTPPAKYDKRCPNCSLLNVCQPKTVTARRSSARWVERQIGEL